MTTLNDAFVRASQTPESSPLTTRGAIQHFLAHNESLPLDSVFQFGTSTYHQYDQNPEVMPQIDLTVWANYIFPEENSYEARTTPEDLRGIYADSYRYLKRMFGPFESKGSAPSIYLEGSAVIETLHGPYHVRITVHSAYKCELIEEEEVPLTPEEVKANTQRAVFLKRQADGLLTATSTAKKTWTCTSIQNPNL